MKLKQVVGLVLGLFVGAFGGFLFSNSLPPEVGSVEEELEILRNSNAQNERRLRSYQRNARRDTTPDELRRLARDVRDGKDISPDDLFATMKPWMRQMSPIFERMREVNEEDWADVRTSEWARQYDLNASQRAQLKEWFRAQGAEQAKALVDVIENKNSGFVDLIRATEYDWKDARGADKLMEGFLKGDQLEEFKSGRLAERAESVQHEADRNLSRLDGIVALDAKQHEQLFGVLSRAAEDYQPGLNVDGLAGEDSALDRRQRDTEIRAALRRDQIEKLDEYQRNRRVEAEKEMRRMMMTLPKDWDLLDRDTF
ncbi:MAG TPA: hypothetical protein DDW68_05075 [Verrucomicrobiales bacterium]|nr:hypothetical protein [Verrucomicrobiales bacterium]HBE96525.1 hypothetical protein [Verrucomicrobiales bacterium]